MDLSEVMVWYLRQTKTRYLQSQIQNQSSSFDSLYISITYFSPPLQAARQMPVIGLNQMSPGGDYGLNGKLEKSKFSHCEFIKKSYQKLQHLSDILEIVMNSRKFQSPSFESLISLTYFSAPLQAARQRPVIGLNQMSPGGDYSHNGRLEKSKFSHCEFI